MRGWWRAASLVFLTGCWPVIPGRWANYGDTGAVDTGTQDTGVHETGRHDTGTQDTGTACDQAFEPNNSEGAATTVTDGQVVHGAICPVYDQDWYTVYVPAGCTGSATLDFTNAAGDLDLSAWSGGANLATSNGTTNQEYVESPLTSGGWLDFEVVGYAQATNTYTLSVAVDCTGDTGTTDTGTTTCQDDSWEPNDVEEGAYPITLDDSVEGVLCQSHSPDWFQVGVNGGCALDATLDFVDANGDLDLYAWWQGTEYDASLGVTDQENVRLFTPYDVDVDLQISPYASAENNYTLTTSEVCPSQAPTCPADDVFEPDDSQTAAFPVIGDGAYLQGVICGNEDWYRTVGTPGCTLTAALAWTAADGTLELTLIDQYGSQLASTTTSPGYATASWTTPNTDPVNAAVVATSGDGIAYTLDFTQACGR